MDERRRIGLEQEFLLVDESGEASERADELLSRCAELAIEEGLDPENFSEECSLGMIEVKTSPVESLEALEEEYLANVRLALRAGRDLGLRLYPLATYPLPLTPSFREGLRYQLQIQTIGAERFLNAGRCFGVHLHLEVTLEVVDPVEIIAQNAPAAGIKEILALHNLATALDPALVALTRSSPFYEGFSPGLAARTAFYRGSREFGWNGVYSELPELGGLKPYAASADEIVEHQVSGCERWKGAMDRSGTGSEHLPEMSEDILDVCWRPVRVSGHGTVELRSMDANYPRVILAVTALVQAAAERVRRENLTVEPVEGQRRFEVNEDLLLVPDFEALSSELLYAAVTDGTESQVITAYLDSILAFATPGAGTNHKYIDGLRNSDGAYFTTEAETVRNRPLSGEAPGYEEGLALVREACDRLEEQTAPQDKFDALANPG